MTSGVYRIKNIKTQRVYIGSTIDIFKRWPSHRSQLANNTHDNSKLQNSYNKWGKDVFRYKLIKKLPNTISVEILLLWEQKFIDKYQSAIRGKGYNICPVAGSCLGRKRKKSSIKKMVETMQKNPRHLTAQQKLHLSNIFKGKKISKETKEKIKLNWRPSKDLIQRGKNISIAKLDNRPNKGKSYQVINPQGELVTIQNLKLFCEENQLTTSGFQKLFQGKRKQYRKFKRSIT